MQTSSNKPCEVTTSLDGVRLWLNSIKSIFIHFIKWASSLYSCLPISDKTKYAHAILLAQYAPCILRSANIQIFAAPVSYVSMVTTFDIEMLIDDNSDLKLRSFSQPIVSVIIPIFGKIEFTLRCLASIALNSPCVPFEVIVVDDCSTDDSLKILSGIKEIRLIVNSENKGFICSCNIGAHASAGQYLCFLNNDTEVTPGWLDELFGTFREFPGTGLSGSKLIYPNGGLQEAGGIIWQDGTAWNFGRNKDQSRPEYNYAREVDYCSGASIMVSKELFEKLEGFDEHYKPAYCEDSDLALKIRDIGHRVIYQPLSVVIHYEGVTSGRDTTQGIKAYQVANCNKLFKRWKEHLKHYQLPGMDVDNAKDRMVKYRVLVLDHCTLTPDQDAGSVTVFNIMLLLREMNFQVTFIPEGDLGYMPDYTPAMQRVGIEVLYTPYCSGVKQHLKEAGKRYDLVFLFRPIVAELHIKSIRKHCSKAKVLFHTVDLHHLRMAREADLLDDVEKKKFAAEMKKKELAVIRAVDASIVHSTTELELLRHDLPQERIYVFPLILDIRGTEKGFNDRRDMVFVGGYQHLPNVDAVKYFVNEIMPLLRLRLPGVHFYVVGSKPPLEIFELQAEDVVIIGFVEDISSLLDEMRVSLAPLRYGAGIKGKIGTAMALGLPTVATSLAAEGMLLSNGENILVADGAEAFAEAVAQLYGDEVLWGRLSRNGLAFAEKAWGAESAWETLNQMLKDLGIFSERGKHPLRMYSQNIEIKSIPKKMQNCKQRTNRILHPIGVCRNRAEFEKLLLADIFKEMTTLESRLLAKARGRKHFDVKGFCVPCNKTVSFLIDMTSGGYLIGDHWIPNWRERLECPFCHMNNRQRLIATLVGQHINTICSSRLDVYFMEQVTPIYKWAKKVFPGHQIIGSEYLGSGYPGGAVVGGIRQEDVMALSFEDSTIDLIVSNDVFEHVPNPSRAFSECMRVLRPGGVMLATIPFHSNTDASVTRAILCSDGLTHVLPPVYHGNPVSADGSLVFTDFGWDMLESVRNSGFKDVRCEIFASLEFCHLGGGQIVFRAVKGDVGANLLAVQSDAPRELHAPHAQRDELHEKPSALVSIMGEVLWHTLTLDPTIEDVSKRHLDTVEKLLGKYHQRTKSRRRLRILEIASYAHTTGYMLSKKTGAEMVLTDISVDTLALGGRTAEKGGYHSDLVKRVAADFHDLPFPDGQFDMVFISSALHHTWDWQVVLNEMLRVLAPGGLLYMDNEPCLREFCFFKFQTNRHDVFRPIEKSLEESGLILTVAQPYLGSRPEALFGMVENQLIPLGEMLNILEAAGEIEKLWLAPEMCMRDFEFQLVKKRKAGAEVLQQIIHTAFKSGISKAKKHLGADDIALGYCLPTDAEINKMTFHISNRLASLKGRESSESFRIELSKIFGAGISVLLRKNGVLPENLSDLEMRYAWGERNGVTIGYPYNIEHILNRIQDLLPNIQNSSDASLRDAFPEEDWNLTRLDNGLRHLSPKSSCSKMFCRNVPVSGSLKILIRVYALLVGAPYRIHLALNGEEVSHFDVYQTESFLFNSETEVPANDFFLTLTASSLDRGTELEGPPTFSVSAVRLCAMPSSTDSSTDAE